LTLAVLLGEEQPDYHALTVPALAIYAVPRSARDIA
jgi:hypothetical protein